jgi:hypothetical protein
MKEVYKWFHIISVLVYFGVAVWEIYTTSTFTNNDISNDMARCFIITMCTYNIILGFYSLYMLLVTYYNQSYTNKIQTNAITFISIWGMIIYFKYTNMITAEYKNLLLAEICLFFTRMVFISIIICCSGKLQNENTLEVKV